MDELFLQTSPQFKVIDYMFTFSRDIEVVALLYNVSMILFMLLQSINTSNTFLIIKQII